MCRYYISFLAMIFVTVVGAFAGISAAEESPTSPVFRIAVVFPGSRADFSWSQSMFDSLESVQEHMGGTKALSLTFSENMTDPLEIEDALRFYASSGCDLVIAHGLQYGEILEKIAMGFPLTSFAWGSSSPEEHHISRNVFMYHVASEQVGYLNGTIAALLTETGTVGIIGTLESEESKQYVAGFQEGAKAVSSNVAVMVSYTDSFDDFALARDAAKVLIGMDVDVLTGLSQQTMGVMEIVKESGVFWLGMQADQKSLASEYVVASQLYDWEKTIVSMIDCRKNGIFGGKHFMLTLRNGGLKMNFNDELQSSFFIKDTADHIVQAIIEETIKPMSSIT